MLNAVKDIKAPVKYLQGEIFAELKIKSKSRYLISTRGRIYSYYSDRILKGALRGSVLVLHFRPDGKSIPVPYAKGGYNMQPQRNGRSVVTIQKLVALTFLPKPPGDCVVIHTDYDKLNNSIDNLKWISLNDQIIGSRGGMVYKDYIINKQKGAKLTHDQVLEIKILLLAKRDGNNTLKIKDIAIRYGITEMNVFRIQNGDIWGHLGPVIKQKEPPKKISESNIIEIKKLLSKGVRGEEIAKRFSLRPETISRIKNGKYYKSV